MPDACVHGDQPGAWSTGVGLGPGFTRIGQEFESAVMGFIPVSAWVVVDSGSSGTKKVSRDHSDNVGQFGFGMSLEPGSMGVGV